jgi:uridine kinase
MFVIGVCGPSCSGKTRTVKAIQESLSEQTTVISQDNYYFSGNENTNYDVPESIDFNLLISQLKDLIQGKTIRSPTYDFTTHSRRKEKIQISPKKVIILEGILIFTQKRLLDLIDLKVYISAYPELAFSRRLKRDVEERGRSIQDVTERYFNHVVPSTKQFVEPSENFSDIVLKNNRHDKFIGIEILLNYLKCKLSD